LDINDLGAQHLQDWIFLTGLTRLMEKEEGRIELIGGRKGLAENPANPVNPV